MLKSTIKCEKHHVWLCNWFLRRNISAQLSCQCSNLLRPGPVLPIFSAAILHRCKYQQVSNINHIVCTHKVRHIRIFCPKHTLFGLLCVSLALLTDFEVFCIFRSWAHISGVCLDGFVRRWHRHMLETILAQAYMWGLRKPASEEPRLLPPALLYRVGVFVFVFVYQKLFTD